MNTPSGVKRMATDGLDTEAFPYEGRILREPVAARRLRNNQWGEIDVQTLQFDVAISSDFVDFYLPADAPETLRGYWIMAERWDAARRLAVVEWSGVFNRGDLRPGVLSVEGTNVDQAVFTQPLPSTVITTALHAGVIPDVGKSVPVILGNVPRVPLVYVREDVLANLYDYLVGHGTVTVSAAYRNGPNGTLYPIGFGECLNASGLAATSWANASRTDLYSGYTALRFPVFQQDFQGGRHLLSADVLGLQTERNFARAIQTILTNTTWGLGKTVDVASFDTAAAALDAIPNLYCDGALTTPVQAQDVLAQLLMVRGMRLGTRAGTTTWTINVDTVQTETRLDLGDALDDGPRNMLVCEPRSAPSLAEAISTVTLAYRPDLSTGTSVHSVSRTLQAIGKPLSLRNDFIRVSETADRVVDYLGKRELAAQTTATATLAYESLSLSEGHLVRVTYAPYGF